MLGDKPNRFLRGHPVQAIEAREIYRPGIAAQGAFEPQIEINIEVTHRQLAQRAINRLAITAAGEVRFRNRAPVPADFENRDHMIGVAFRFQVEDQRPKSQDPKRGGRENTAFKAGRGAFMKDLSR